MFACLWNFQCKSMRNALSTSVGSHIAAVHAVMPCIGYRARTCALKADAGIFGEDRNFGQDSGANTSSDA